MGNLSMRDAFLQELYKRARDDCRIVLLTADYGAPALDEWRQRLPGQFFAVGIAEQNMVSIAAGLALSGKRPYCYAIAPFLTLRCYEQIRDDVCLMNLPVTLVGVSGGFGYDDSGPTHHALEDIAVMRVLPNMTILSSADSNQAQAFARHTLGRPTYIRLDREEWPDINYDNTPLVGQGEDLTILATGCMVRRALEVAEELEKSSIRVGIVNMAIIPPPNIDVFKAKAIATIEEHFLAGGIGSLVAEELAKINNHIPLKCFGIPREFSFNYGGRAALHKQYGLDTESLTSSIADWLKEASANSSAS